MKTPLRITWLCPYPTHDLGPFGLQVARVMSSHACSWIVNLLDALRQRDDCAVDLVTTTPTVDRRQTVVRDGVTIHVLKHAFPFTNRGFPEWLPFDALFGYPLVVPALRGVVRRIRPDIVHGHGVESPYGLAAVGLRFPHVVSVQGVLGEVAKISGSRKHRMGVLWERWALRRARHILCRTRFDTAYAHAANPRARIHDAPEAMGPVFFSTPWDDPPEPRILFVGSYLRYKGLDDLVGAVALLKRRIPDVTLDAVGGGSPPDQARVESCIRGAGLEGRVRLLGRRTAEEIARLHRSSRVFVLPSHIDNSPNALVEAMVSGMPVVGTEVGGVGSLVEDGRTGLLVPSRSPEGLASAILSLLESPGRRRELAKNALSVRPRHWPPNVAERTVQIYREVLKGG